jgi:flagella basal body P-ring formation protein FlgA
LARIALAASAAFAGSVSDAAEVRLRKECRPEAPVVTLGDVADVLAADPAESTRLGAVELFAAPPPGQQRFLGAREVQDLLLLRGVDLLKHCFSGSSQVAVLGPAADRPTGSRFSSAVKRNAEGKVRQAILRYLKEHGSGDEPWEVALELEDHQAQLVMGSDREILVRGGMPPWTGAQQFGLTVTTADGPRELVLDVQVTLPPAVVVAAGPLPAGSAVRAEDIRLERVQGRTDRANPIHSVEEVVGKETLRSIPAGGVIQRDHLRRPLLVRRGEMISVRAGNSRIQVKTVARAKEDGCLGDLIAVEPAERRKSYFARVSGIQEAEVSIQPPRIGPFHSGELRNSRSEAALYPIRGRTADSEGVAPHQGFWAGSRVHRDPAAATTRVRAMGAMYLASPHQPRAR